MNFNELFPLQVFINLDKRKDRLEKCKKEFEKIGINPIRKSGYVPDHIENSYVRGVVGCMVSHYQILQAAYLLGTNVVIMEDDVMFLDDKYNVKHVLDLACNELENKDWDMLYIIGNVMAPIHQMTSHLGKLTTHCQNTAGYCVNSKFLGKLLNYIDLNNITEPIDVIYSSKVVPENNCFITVPMTAVQRNDYSDIEERPAQYADYMIERYDQNLVKKD